MQRLTSIPYLRLKEHIHNFFDLVPQFVDRYRADNRCRLHDLGPDFDRSTPARLWTLWEPIHALTPQNTRPSLLGLQNRRDIFFLPQKDAFDPFELQSFC